MPIEAGQQLLHDRLIDKIGEGGMGVVWKAVDTTLDREVAIKVLPEDADPERLRRFELEARAASALNHPNIVHIYGIGRHEGMPYIAMELVNGTTLREFLGQGPLPYEKLLRYGTQIAEGLAKAHHAGIVHRDLKPENLMISVDDHAKILYFGLAKLIDDSGGFDPHDATATREHTALGMVVGTASYMSPEQALGQPIDARTDVFSLGAVLHEMATGTRPFQGQTLPAIFDQILNHQAPSASSLNSGLPVNLDLVIQKALEKDRDRRYPSAKELLADLRQEPLEGVVSPPPGKKSVLVLPFQNVSPDPEQEYFCDGMTDEIISNLSGVESLRVISRTSSMLLKGTGKNIKTIGEELDVRYVLEGSVRKMGDNLRITAQLVEAARDTHMWSERYSGTVDNIFDVQENVSRAIVDALQINLNSAEQKKIARRPFDNVKVYECYHRARRDTLNLTFAGLESAARELQAGLDIAGDNALLYAGMADVYLQQCELGVHVDDAPLQKVDELSRKITEMEPDSAVGYYLAGRLERFRGTMVTAAGYFEQALSRDPKHGNTLMMLAVLYGLQIGKSDLAWPMMNRLIEVDPLTPLTLICEGFLHWAEGRLDEAHRSFDRIAALQPDAPPNQCMFIAHILVRQGRHDELAALAQRVVNEGWDGFPADLCLFYEAAVSKGATVGPRKLSEETRAYMWRDPDLAWWVADAYALHGETDEALRWLGRTVEQGWINYPLWRDDPLLESVRGDKRFRKMMDEVQNKWDRFERFDPESE